MNTRLLASLVVILLIAILGLSIDRLSQISEDDLIATVEQKISLVGTDADLPATFEAYSTQFSKQDHVLETQIVDAIADENIPETIDAQGNAILTQVAEFYPSDTPTPTSTNTATSTSTPTSTNTATFTPTITATRTPSIISNISIFLDTPIDSLAFDISPDGRNIVYGADNKLIIRSIKTLEVIKELEHNNGVIHTIAWSPDSQFIVAGGTISYIVVWDARSGEQIFTENFRQRIESIDWSPDSERIVVGSATQLTSWDVEENRLSREYSTQSLKSVAWSPQGNIVVVGSQVGAFHFGVNTNVVVRPRVGSKEIGGLVLPIASVKFNTDGSLFATLTESGVLTVRHSDSFDRLWHTDTEFETGSELTWSPEGQYIAAIADKSLIVWDVQTQEELILVSLDSLTVHDIHWSNNGDKIFLLTDVDIKTVEIPHTMFIETELPTPLPTYTLTPTPMSTSSNTPLPTLTPESLTVKSSKQVNINNSGIIAISPQSNAIALLQNGQKITILSSETGEILSEFDNFDNGLVFIDWASNSPEIAVTTIDNKVFVVNTDTEEILLLDLSEEAIIQSLAISSDGQAVMLGTVEDVRIWLPYTNRSQIRDGGATVVDWRTDGEFAVGIFDKRVELLTINANNNFIRRGTQLTSSFSPLSYVKWSKNSDLIAILDMDEKLTVWNTTSKVILWQTTIDGVANALAWSADSEFIAIGTEKTLSIYDISQEVLLFSVTLDLTIQSVEWSADSTFIVTGNTSGFTIIPVDNLISREEG